MASNEQENVLNENSGTRRTRSSKRVTSSQSIQASPARATRRSKKQQQQEQFIEQSQSEDETHKEQEEDFEEVEEEEDAKSNIIKEMLAEAAQGVIIVDGTDNHNENNTEKQCIEIADDDDCVIYEEQITEEEVYETPPDEVPVIVLDDKSSSFPFAAEAGQSEISDDANEQQDDELHAETENNNGQQENSLMASLAGDNANSLPSMGVAEQVETTVLDEKMDSEDSLSSQPAIAEDLVANNADNASDATMANTEIISEDELPPPTKPEINDAEEVSDEELPAPQRAELPADAEVISEDELPTAVEKCSPSPLNKSDEEVANTTTTTRKRKVEDVGDDDDGGAAAAVAGIESEKNNVTEAATATTSKAKKDEEYNPMSPTSESNDAPPVEKKAKTEDSDHKEKRKEKERDKESSSSKDKDKERTEKDKEKEKEKKKLPELDKHWRAVKDDPADFTGWTYLLQYVDNESDAEAAREAYDAFLAHYPYCYGYWRKYADYEKRKGIKANCNTVFERGLEAIPLSVDLWIHFLSHVKSSNPEDEEYIRSQFERAIRSCGLEFRSDKLWDAYLKWENEGKRHHNMVKIYDRLLTVPTQGYSGHFDNFQDLINQHNPTSTISVEEIIKLRTEFKESSSKSSSRSKSRRSSSSANKEKETEKEKEKSKDDDKDKEQSAEATDEPMIIDADAAEGEKASENNNSSPKKTNSSPENLADLTTLNEQEIIYIKDKVISSRRKLHKNTVSAVTARWSFEEGIKRPYFHVKPLERCQLKNWKDYLDFEIEKGDRVRILVLFERCLIACALYDEFWLKMIRYLESHMDLPDSAQLISDVYRRACDIHHPDKPSIHLMWSAFEECQNNFDKAAEILVNLEKKVPNLLQVAYRRINVERRRGDYGRCKELYEHYIETAKNKNIAGSLAIKYGRFLNKICNDLEAGLKVLRLAQEKDPANTRVALQMIDLVLQRSKVDEDEVVLIMDKFMAREGIEPEQKVLFAQRKVEFLEDFGNSAKGLQDAQRALQIALNKANEAKKKRESSPSRKSSHKDTSVVCGSAQAYNNGSASAAGYNYGPGNSSAYYGQQNSGNAYSQQQQSYDSYYNHWQYNTGYSGYGQWSGYSNYY